MSKGRGGEGINVHSVTVKVPYCPVVFLNWLPEMWAFHSTISMDIFSLGIPHFVLGGRDKRCKCAVAQHRILKIAIWTVSHGSFLF